jgi:hypothetical protein
VEGRAEDEEEEEGVGTVDDLVVVVVVVEEDDDVVAVAGVAGAAGESVNCRGLGADSVDFATIDDTAVGEITNSQRTLFVTLKSLGNSSSLKQTEKMNTLFVCLFFLLISFILLDTSCIRSMFVLAGDWCSRFFSTRQILNVDFVEKFDRNTKQ